jgi:hypothetical protein
LLEEKTVSQVSLRESNFISNAHEVDKNQKNLVRAMPLEFCILGGLDLFRNIQTLQRVIVSSLGASNRLLQGTPSHDPPEA